MIVCLLMPDNPDDIVAAIFEDSGKDPGDTTRPGDPPPDIDLIGIAGVARMLSDALGKPISNQAADYYTKRREDFPRHWMVLHPGRGKLFRKWNRREVEIWIEAFLYAASHGPHLPGSLAGIPMSERIKKRGDK